MKVLHLHPYIPAPPDFGGAIRIYHILKHLTENHDVTVAGFGNRGDMEALLEAFPALKGKTHYVTHPWRRKLKKLIQFYSLFTDKSYWLNMSNTNRMQRNLEDLLSTHDFDLIQAEFPPMGAFNLKSDAIKILDAHNVEYDNFRRMSKLEGKALRRFFYTKEFKKFYKEEIEICRKQDAVFTTSDRDRQIFEEDLPEVPKYVIPNGVDMDFFHPAAPDTKPEPHSLVFVGTMGYVPNFDGIKYFLNDILPLIRKQIPDIKLYIVGKNAPAEIQEQAGDNVVITGFVDDVRPYVWKSSVYVVPLRMGGGTRLKVLEALAMKKPMVTTQIGCEGIDVTHGESALIANEPEAFSEAVIRLLKDKKLRQQIMDYGYELVGSKYSWDVIGEHLEEAYGELLKPSVVV
jgi:glycosyltransferase involved in cell wall biosynthesis